METLKALREAMPKQAIPAIEDCITRLYDVLPDKENLRNNTVLVCYGGGKDSAYTTAFMRAVHLGMAERHNGETFMLRIATMRHAGMPYVVMQNIDRSYEALGVYDDPNTELLLIERNDVRPFERDLAMPQTVISYNRIDHLMGGHRSFGDGRSTFCNACNLNVANSFGVVAGYDGGVDFIVTGDSPEEQTSYVLWMRSLARKANLKIARGKSFQSTLETLNGLSRAYFKEIHGADNTPRIDERGVTYDVPERLEFFSIYDDTEYEAGAHWSLLTEFMGFVFDDIAFSFTESDCANPALMAHLRGLRTERVYKRTYDEGIGQYLDFALKLMEKKDFPPHLIDVMRERYSSQAGTESMRSKADQYALEALGLTNEQLVCMVYSPFAAQGEHLKSYLENEQPELVKNEAEIRAMLAGEKNTNLELSAQLENIN